MPNSLHIGNLPKKWRFLTAPAKEMGAVAIGICPAKPLPEEISARFRNWCSSPFCGEMEYLRNNLAARANPGHSDIVRNASVVVSVAFPYGSATGLPAIWRYVAAHARGRDYHKTIRKKLTHIAQQIQYVFPHAKWRVFVDSAPVMERSWAILAGTGTLGRNGMVLVPGVGARVLLGEIIIAAVPAYPDAIFVPSRGPFDYCDDCNRCQSACPTGALQPNGTVNAPLCLSYITVEKYSKPPSPIQLKHMTRFFGCDICVSVCPKNSCSTSVIAPPHVPVLASSLDELVSMNADTLQDRVRGTCLYRTGATQLQHFAAVVLQNLKYRK